MELEPGWCVVLGASSGFGGAAARAFAQAGLNVLGVHLDRKATLPNAHAVMEDVEKAGRQALFLNINAADEEKRGDALNQLTELIGSGPRVRVLLHSLAFGTLKPLVSSDAKSAVSSRQLAMTMEVMASSLVDWTQGLVQADLFEPGASVFAMTSAGSSRVWPAYGPVSAAKAALESYVRQLSMELAPKSVRANAICAGVTDTAALRKIPGSAEMIEDAKRRNPSGRLTTPEDVADAMVALASPRCRWVTGNVIRVDGGEGIVA